jgi:DNA-binding transcriptional LysR family regulator
MIDISDSKIRNLDPTALLVFVGLLQHRRTTVVAQRMGLTQSAISQALRRLRVLFDDPLFLRRPHGLEPTAVARELEPIIGQIVELLKQTIGETAGFDPKSSTRVIRIAASEYELASIMPALLAVTGAKGHSVRIYTLPLGRTEALARLSEGTVDLVLGYYWDVGDTFLTSHLYDEQYVVVARTSHPLFRGKMTVERFAEARHLLVTPDGEARGIVDEALAIHGLSRRVAASVPLFLPALASLAAGDLVASLPSRIARTYCGAFGLEQRPMPLFVRTFPVSVLYHRRNEKSAMVQWVLEVLGSSTAEGPKSR